MNDPLPAPEFDRTKYDRPNQDWVCGRMCEGQPCHLGPTPGGQCRSTAECRPLLETQPGETKGRWRCTRSKDAGGPCASGPGPQGTCGCPIIPCVPRRSLRRLRGRVVWATIAVTVGVLLALAAGPWRWRFLSPGRVSSPHQSAGFHARATTLFGSGDCAGCHAAAEGGLSQWLQAAFHAEPRPWAWGALAQATAALPTRMDERNCRACHAEYDRHQPTVTAAHSCSDCHREHQGAKIPPPRDETCASCHAQAGRLSQFSSTGWTNLAEFHPPLPVGLRAFLVSRPAGQPLQLFANYWQGHPDFRLHADGVKDSSNLRFNHQLHFGATVRIFDASSNEARTLSCQDCHQPDTTGAYLARIRFEQHCQSCHSLQFDPVNPELKLPHGNAAAVAASVSSLAGLQVQYADLARRRGETDRTRIDEFARTSAARVRRLVGTGEALVDSILFTGDPRSRMLDEAQAAPTQRAHYAGCAYCHEVRRDPQGQPLITPPNLPDRWLPGGRFHHARHTQISCLECHGTVLQSTQTSDINLPHQIPVATGTAAAVPDMKACIDCHRPGGAPANCATCHSYHMLKPL